MDKASPTKGRNHQWQGASAKLGNSEQPKLQRQPGMEGGTSRLVCKAAQGPEEESQCCPYPAGQPGAGKERKQSES